MLAALLDGPLHGYAILQRAEETSGGRVKISVGTLYGALDRLLQENLVEIDSEDVVEGRFRRSYRLTDLGESALSAEAERMQSAAQAVLSHASLAKGKGGRKRVVARQA